MPRKATNIRPLSMAPPAPRDPYLRLALVVIRSGVHAKDWKWFEGEMYQLWLGYVQACLPGELEGYVLPAKVREQR